MVQEIITYTIIGLAILSVLLRTVKIRKKSEKNSKGVNFSRVTFTVAHDCDSCSAECALRDTVQTRRVQDSAPCEQITVKSN